MKAKGCCNSGSYTCGKHNKKPFLLSVYHFSPYNATAFISDTVKKYFMDHNYPYENMQLVNLKSAVIQNNVDAKTK